ncbi:hypothetical protein DSM109990_03879 (plasmid) [Sulfitobacter dubius]|uniref:Uncharacterized protein n=1 Tax=Sulfitobacter dubius TaxID=218673 RepID=A0ABY3ZQU3_9RHOB|nr:hypothetical protein DSM109990_03879 [Sulfitobacter dubius]
MAAKRPARASLRYAKAPLSPRYRRELRQLLGHCSTKKGKQVTDDYGKFCRRLLIEQIESLPEFDNRLKDAGQSLNTLAGIYEEISRIAATHRR